LIVPVPPPSKTASLAVLAAFLVLAGCGGRSSGILGAGSGANEGGSSGNVTGTPEGATVETLPEASVADSPSEPGSEGSSGNSVVDAGADATGVGGGSVDATEGLEASALIDAADASEAESEPDVVVPCGPPASGTFFVDPNAGHDDDGGTGSQGCPFKSLTHTLSLVEDAGAPVTVEIVNTSAAPTLSQSTGEVFPITVLGGVTITAEDTTKNTPTVEVGVSPATSNPAFSAGNLCAPSCARGFYLDRPNARLSHLVLDDPGLTVRDYAIAIASAGTVTIDHVTVQNFVGDGIIVYAPAVATPTIGPGVVVHGCAGAGIHSFADNVVTILGGAGADHTSFTQNEYGIWMYYSSIDIQGTAISQANPDASDVDVDDNEIGLLLSPPSGSGTATVRGLHAVGNTDGGILCGLSLTLRGSYIANNKAQAGFAGGFEVYGSGSMDLGNPAGPDYGRNIFVGNTGGDICGASAQQPVLAAGNIFGTTDCAVGGKLDPSVTCGDTTTVNVANCTF
jgi:hypothetical protein